MHRICALVVLFVAAGVEASCDAGLCHRRSGVACALPPLGFVADADPEDLCRPCPRGTYTAEQGGACIAPPSGQVVTIGADGTSNCTGNYVPASPPTECIPCPVGHHANDDHTLCLISVTLATSSGSETLLGRGMFERAGKTFKSIMITAMILIFVVVITPFVLPILGITACWVDNHKAVHRATGQVIGAAGDKAAETIRVIDPNMIIGTVAPEAAGAQMAARVVKAQPPRASLMSTTHL